MRVKFNEQDGVLLISERELVKTARREISISVPLDEDELKLNPASLYTKRRLLLQSDGLEIRERVFIGEYEFEILARMDGVSKNVLTKVFEGDLNPKRLRKDEKAEARGEAYIFAYLYLKRHSYNSVTLEIIYVNQNSGEFIKESESVTKAALEAFFTKCAHKITIYAGPEIERVKLRAPSMNGVKFPYKAIREPQREFMQSVYRAISHGTTLFANAPTGTGKTAAVLYPAIRALGEEKITKCFYLTPKGTTMIAAKECIELFCKQKVKIKAIVLTAKEKICINRSVCKNSREDCKYIKNNALGLAALKLYNLDIPVITNKEIKNVSEEVGVCPYELSLAYSELCDVIICDFNYLFDTRVYIRRFFDEGGEYLFLIDEAHNLPDRAREMYSSEISNFELSIPCESILISEHSEFKRTIKAAEAEFYNILYPFVSEEMHEGENGEKTAFAHLKEVPDALFPLFERLLTSCDEALFESYKQKDENASQRTNLVREYGYRVSAFYKAICRFSSSYELFVFFENGALRAKAFCIDTGADIVERLKRGRAAVFFSATLSPLYYYKSVLGGDGSSEILSVDSPFDPSQLSVSIVDSVSTRYSEREDTLLAVSKIIAATVSPRRGNYMVFCPSFEYAERLYKVFRSKYPKINIILQERNMTKKEKEDFLLQFKSEDKSYLIGFCVMGGIYSEGVDLAGDSLIGAVVVGIGMPNLSYEREAIQSYYDEKYEEGKQFAYLYPGLNRVLQAAGRVIRREDDRGVIVLIDDRFADPLYKKTVPTLWRGMKFIKDAASLNENIKRFWNGEK